MLVTLAIWIVIAPAALGYGWLLLRSERQSLITQPIETLASAVFIGLLGMAALCEAFALGIGLKWWVGTLVLLPGFVYASRTSALKTISRHTGVMAGFIAAVVALFVSTREVNLYDTALYHQQAVKWLSEDGLVWGVALLHVRLGWTSSWFALAAPLNHGFLAGRVPSIVGGFLFALMVIPSLIILVQLQTRRSFPLRSATWAVFCMMLIATAVVWNVEISLSPDLAVWLAPMVAVTVLTDKSAPAVDRIGQTAVIAALACLIKLSALPLLGYSLVLAVKQFAQHPTGRKRTLAYFTVVCITTSVLASANTKTSGCPLFPSSVACLSTDWSVGAGLAAESQAEIRQFALAGGFLGRQTAALLVLALASTIIAVRLAWSSSFVRQVLGMSWAGILFVLVAAPNPRFGLGYFLLAPAIAFTLFVQRFLTRFLYLVYSASFTGWLPRVSIGAFLVSCVLVLAHVNDSSSLLYPVRMAASTGDPIHVLNRTTDRRENLLLAQDVRHGIAFFLPLSSDQCWDAPLPCTPSLQVDQIVLRDEGRGLAGGFVKGP